MVSGVELDDWAQSRIIRITITITTTYVLDGLRSYMAKFGDIDACTIMRDPSGRSRGFAFLTYTNASSVTKVLSQVHTLDGKQVSRDGKTAQMSTRANIRSTQNALSLEQSMKRPQRSLSEVSHLQSHQRDFGLSSRNSEKFSMRLSCLIGRLAGAKGSLLLLLQMSRLSVSR
jgi:hypothetical protein